MAFGSHSGQRLAWRACRRVPPPSRAHRRAARTASPPAYPSPPRPGSRAARSSASGVRARPSAPSPGFPPAATPPAPRLTARARAQARPHSRTPPSPAAILALSTSRLRARCATGPSGKVHHPAHTLQLTRQGTLHTCCHRPHVSSPLGPADAASRQEGGRHTAHTCCHRPHVSSEMKPKKTSLQKPGEKTCVKATKGGVGQTDALSTPGSATCFTPQHNQTSAPTRTHAGSRGAEAGRRDLPPHSSRCAMHHHLGTLLPAEAHYCARDTCLRLADSRLQLLSLLRSAAGVHRG